MTTQERVEAIVRAFQAFGDTLKVPDELTGDFDRFSAYVTQKEADWLRTTLTQALQEQAERQREVVTKEVNKKSFLVQIGEPVVKVSDVLQAIKP